MVITIDWKTMAKTIRKCTGTIKYVYYLVNDKFSSWILKDWKTFLSLVCVF